MPVFPVSRSLVQILRRFSNILRNRLIAWLQLLETLHFFFFFSIIFEKTFFVNPFFYCNCALLLIRLSQGKKYLYTNAGGSREGLSFFLLQVLKHSTCNGCKQLLLRLFFQVCHLIFSFYTLGIRKSIEEKVCCESNIQYV